MWWLRRSISVISTSARLSARAAAMPAKPPPTIKTRFLSGTGFVTGGVSCGNDLVRTVVMGAPTVSPGPTARLASDTAGLRADLGRRCGALNDRALSCGRGQEALVQHARRHQADGHDHSHSSIALRGPVARASRTSGATAPFSATGRPEKSACAGSEFVVNRYRRTNRTGVCDVSLESYQIGMSHNAVGNIDGEVVGGIACACLRHEGEIPGAIIGRTRVCDGCRDDKAGGCNQPERRRLH